MSKLLYKVILLTITFAVSLIAQIDPSKEKVDVSFVANLENIKNSSLRIESINRVWDGGSVRIDCIVNELKFQILMKRPKENGQQDIRVIVIDPLKPNIEHVIVAGSPLEARVKLWFNDFTKKNKMSKHVRNINIAINYINNRNSPWDDSVWGVYE